MQLLLDLGRVSVSGLPGELTVNEAVLELMQSPASISSRLGVHLEATAEDWRLACFLGFGLLYVCILG